VAYYPLMKLEYKYVVDGTDLVILASIDGGRGWFEVDRWPATTLTP